MKSFDFQKLTIAKSYPAYNEVVCRVHKLLWSAPAKVGAGNESSQVPPAAYHARVHVFLHDAAQMVVRLDHLDSGIIFGGRVPMRS